MKILMVLQHVNFFRNLDTVVRELDRRGHEVVLLHGTRLGEEDKRSMIARKRERLASMSRGIEVAQAEVSMVVGYRPVPDERWHRLLRRGREIVNRSIYLRSGHPSPARVASLLENRLSPAVQALFRSRVVARVLRHPVILTFWRHLEKLSPPSRTVVEVLQGLRPDVVLVVPTVWPKEPVEADYLRAAQALGIPSIGYLNSWDNLTSKGTVHVVPDIYLVWNEALAEEAVQLHDLPANRIRVTGAAHLDRFFDLKPTTSPDQIRRLMGCDPGRPYLVYLCSSRTLIPDETDIVRALGEALPRLRGDRAPTLIVRPHPTNPTPWQDFEQPGVVVYPKLGDQADSPESWQEYYDQLDGATCVIGLNTTAFLESVVVDIPCLTIVADEFHDAQGKTGHFRHLIAADFLEVSHDIDGVARCVGRILDGSDEKRAGRRHFTEWFLRPCGIDRPATLEVVDAIEETARRRVASSREGLGLRVPRLVRATQNDPPS